MANKVPKRISILAADGIAALPELQKLAEQGHVVHSFSQFHEAADPDEMIPLVEYDLILSDSACAYLPGMERWLPEMVKGARARRYGVAKAINTEV